MLSGQTECFAGVLPSQAAIGRQRTSNKPNILPVYQSLSPHRAGKHACNKAYILPATHKIREKEVFDEKFPYLCSNLSF
ncbi:hypothetical protein HMPREF1981_00407 [Bacteroides pyogenes F0041]|uniref:Uncharacterized protein n=1 Tax=Bacteroides pyogenes F0041 TaxID=1321819 RepID=U2E3A2_9BACE|nr:hypothetical protein HMPREF1981_00407 [Bacteroides pyogenes F0041]